MVVSTEGRRTCRRGNFPKICKGVAPTPVTRPRWGLPPLFFLPLHTPPPPLSFYGDTPPLLWVRAAIGRGGGGRREAQKRRIDDTLHVCVSTYVRIRGDIPRCNERCACVYIVKCNTRHIPYTLSHVHTYWHNRAYAYNAGSARRSRGRVHRRRQRGGVLREIAHRCAYRGISVARVESAAPGIKGGGVERGVPRRGPV